MTVKFTPTDYVLELTAREAETLAAILAPVRERGPTRQQRLARDLLDRIDFRLHPKDGPDE